MSPSKAFKQRQQFDPARHAHGEYGDAARECSAARRCNIGAGARQWSSVVRRTVSRSPENGGTRAPRKNDAMQPPMGVPANTPLTVAVVTRPEGA